MRKRQHLLTTSELATARGVTRQAIAAQVKRGTLVPVQITSGGHFLFDQKQVQK